MAERIVDAAVSHDSVTALFFLTDQRNLPAALATPDAAFNRALNRDPYAYFFSGNEYVRYRWNPGAVDGVGAFANVSYLFKEGSYLRFQWVDGAAEPHGDGGPRSIRDNWLGLEAMLLAGKATASALEWVAVARTLLDTRELP